MPSLLESAQGMTVVGAMRLPRAVLSTIAGRPVEIGGNTLDLHTQALFRLLNTSGRPRPESQPLDVARGQLVSLTRAVGVIGPTEVSSVDESIPSSAGLVPIRVYRPRTVPESAPVLVYYHGGGWVIGDIETHDGICRAITDAVSCITVSVDYRRAPENPFPAAVEDASAAFRWAAANARRLGGDPGRVAVGGDSAGGNLAAVVSRLALEQGGAVPFLQALFFPATNLSADSTSHETFADTAPLYESTARWFCDQYVPDAQRRTDPRCSPLLAESFAGMPRTYLTTAGFDVLRDEGVEFAQKLSAAGVVVAHRQHASLTHWYIHLGRVVPAAAEAFEQDLAAIKRMFG